MFEISENQFAFAINIAVAKKYDNFVFANHHLYYVTYPNRWDTTFGGPKSQFRSIVICHICRICILGYTVRVFIEEPVSRECWQPPTIHPHSPICNFMYYRIQVCFRSRFRFHLSRREFQHHHRRILNPTTRSVTGPILVNKVWFAISVKMFHKTISYPNTI